MFWCVPRLPSIAAGSCNWGGVNLILPSRYNLGVVALRPAPEVDLVPRMDLLNRRPSTAHADLRNNRVRNAEDVARQINSNSTTKKLRSDQLREVEASVLIDTKQKSEADAKTALELFRVGQLDYRADLVGQTQAREERIQKRAEKEETLNRSTKPFKQTVLDEEYAQARRQHERSAAQDNITMETQRQR
jgi:hypothetical protein